MNGMTFIIIMLLAPLLAFVLLNTDVRGAVWDSKAINAIKTSKVIKFLLVILLNAIKYLLIGLVVLILVNVLMWKTRFIEWVLIPIGITNFIQLLLIILISPILVIVLIQKNKYIKLVFVSLVLAFVFMMSVVMPIINPLYRSEEKIREYVLEITPIGTSMDEVLAVIEKQEKWKLRHVIHENGYLNSDYASSNSEYTIVGEKHILVRLGITWWFAYGVYAYLGFDSHEMLIDARISIQSNR